jgi:Domain of unknown function (DUF4965)/Domain of unknown function (DUF1793)/Domain of unknown function (DUF4964)/Domain of unknown function (DUF5127)
MKKLLGTLFLTLSIAFLVQAQVTKAPAYPLVTHDPYFSIWSFGENLTDEPTKHWTGKSHPLEGVINVDGIPYQFIGRPFSKPETVLPTAAEKPYSCRYTFDKPINGWEKPEFAATGWEIDTAPFGTRSIKAAKTEWKEGTEIWLRREFDMKTTLPDGKLNLDIRHDDDAEVFINGVLAWSCTKCWTSDYVQQPLSNDIKKLLKIGKNIIAVHCKNPRGNGFIDVGLSADLPLPQVAKAEQKSVVVTATRTTYTFHCGGVEVQAEFMSPLIASELEILARPVSYLTIKVKAFDGQKHKVSAELYAAPIIAAHDRFQEVEKNISVTGNNLHVASCGVKDAKILGQKGDDVRIDWGKFYLAMPESKIKTPLSIVPRNGQDWLKAQLSFATVSTTQLSEYVLLGYDDEFSVQYFEQNLRGWYHKGGSFAMKNLLDKANVEYAALKRRCVEYDDKIYNEAVMAGGIQYADLCVMAYRQAMAAHKLTVNPDQSSSVPYLWFSKENFSNGSIGTVDVTYPSIPLFLCYNPELAKAMCEPIYYYNESGRWILPFAPHDVGTYPIANGQTYPRDMPVEECGNMLIMAAAIAKAEGNANYAKEHWKSLTAWAKYLKEKGFDPENQLCTDDFAGHLARNTNLSVKAIVGLACYGMLARQLGDAKTAEDYLTTAKKMAMDWEKLAFEDDHYALTFDKEPAGTWSQKYNLVWDKLLNLKLFSQTVYQREIAFYLQKQNKFGLPLDNRRTYTKADWIIWTATLTDKQADFEQFIKPLHLFATETPTRVPLTDWYETTDGKQVGFQARSVVGGFWIKVLQKKWNVP